MEPGSKTFPCTASDCLLSFKTEDHLNVHSKKHELNLNLEIPSKLNLFSDQTPTPTRLIGKCEEVGLFEDLRNVNPFDETFRRAVESRTTTDGVGSETIPIGTVSDGDTLHTPHIFPPVAEVKTLPVKDRRPGKHRVSKLTVTSRTVVSRRADSKTSGAVQTAVKRKVDSMVSILPKPAPVAESQPVVVVAYENEHRQQPTVVPVKAKLKEHIVRNIKAEPPKVAVEQKSSNGVVEEVIQNDTQPYRAPSCIQKDERSQRHERSKAAAQRYRARIKQDQARLHKKNLDLEEENLSLKTELKKLRRALALHRDCSVTRAMKANAERFASTLAMKSDHPSQIPLSSTEQRSITTCIVDNHAVNVNPIFIVLNRGAATVSGAAVVKKDDAT